VETVTRYRHYALTINSLLVEVVTAGDEVVIDAESGKLIADTSTTPEKSAEGKRAGHWCVKRS